MIIRTEIILLIEQQIKVYQQLNQWFQSPLGQLVSSEFSQQLSQATAYLKGDILLQLGLTGDSHWLSTLNYKNKLLASPMINTGDNQIVTSLNHLPFNRNSIDCILAPLTIEPLGIGLIDEIDRVLKPMGYVIFFSLNPWSLWGGAIKCGLLSDFILQPIKMKTPFSLNRSLIQRGYKQCALNHFCYIPPVNNQTLLKRLIFLEEIGKMLWPFPSGFYCCIAQKHTVITPRLTPLFNGFKCFEPLIN